MAERKAGPRTSKPFTTRREKKDSKKNAFQKLAKLKSREGEISLSRSQQQGYSTTYSPRFCNQVVCKGFLLQFFALLSSRKHKNRAYSLRNCTFPKRLCPFKRTGIHGPSSFKERGACAIHKLRNILPSSTDSDLEAFSHNRSHVSFAALPFQATANTNDAIKRFLSY